MNVMNIYSNFISKLFTMSRKSLQVYKEFLNRAEDTQKYKCL